MNTSRIQHPILLILLRLVGSGDGERQTVWFVGDRAPRDAVERTTRDQGKPSPSGALDGARSDVDGQVIMMPEIMTDRK